MKKLVLLFACALFFKLVISPLYVELVGPDQAPSNFDGWMAFFKGVSIVIFIITIPLITFKYLKD
jgi:hypothetical protein